MTKHLCIQCKHYKTLSGNTGQCKLTGDSVWSMRPECAATPIDMFEALDTLGNQLRNARESAGLSREDVCMEFEIPMRTLQNWELDERKPATHTVNMLKDFYSNRKPNCLGILQTITGQESGIVIFTDQYIDGDIIICNWSSIDGIPRVSPLGTELIGLNEQVTVLSETKIQDISELINTDNIIWDVNGDANTLSNCGGKLYEVEMKDGQIIKVIAPDGWN